jgi:hypothetical protein
MCDLRAWEPSHVQHGFTPTFLLEPITVRQFIDRGGFTSKDALIDWVYDNARMPASEYWDYQLIRPARGEPRRPASISGAKPALPR